MAILAKVLSSAWRFVKARALELNSALAEPQHLENDNVSREHENSVFQPRNY
jgi:hypothetical protein